MPELTLENIDQISREIKRQEITFSHLPDDLIDHICCDIEEEMRSGLAFGEAYLKIRQKMGSRRLKEIQEETLYAVDTKYRQMKNTMKISGIAGTVLLGFAALFKIHHWPLAGIMFTLGAFSLAFIFMPSALGVLWKETHSRKRIFLFISAFFAGFFFITGTLFKVQHWPGAGLLITLAALFGILFFVPALLANRLKDTESGSKKAVYILGALGAVLYMAGILFKLMNWPFASVFSISSLVLLCMVVLPWYTWITWREETHIGSNFLYLIIAMMVIILPGALVNMNLQNSYESGFYSHLERQQMIYDLKSEQNNQLLMKYRDSLAYPQLEEIHSRTTNLLTYISDIQKKMVQEAEGEPGNPSIAENQIIVSEYGAKILYARLSAPFNKETAYKYFNSGNETLQNLESEISKFSEFIAGIAITGDHDISGIKEASGELSSILPESNNLSLISALHSLELMKNTLLLIESKLLSTVAYNK